MHTLAHDAAAWGYDRYDEAWRRIARDGMERAVAIDTRAHGWRYLSLNALVLEPAEAAQLRRLTRRFGRFLDWATAALLEDSAWWPELAWPGAALELARQEPPHPRGRCTLYGRFDWLLDGDGRWQLVEYNADTPSGGREASLERGVQRLHARRRLASPSAGLRRRLAGAIVERVQAHAAETGRAPRRVGVVSSHSWTEDMAQAWWLALLVRKEGLPILVGDVTDLEIHHRRVTLRGHPIDALYRFYPLERLYRHGIFAPLMEAVLDRRLLLLNGLRGFLAQSKATLAYLWARRGDAALGRGACGLIERHLPATVRARQPGAERRLVQGVVKHVNGREGEAVKFGELLSVADWEARLLEGGYVVQERVHPVAVEDVVVDEVRRQVRVEGPRYACVGGFCIDGDFGGCYSRLDGPITTAAASYVPTLLAPRPPAASEGGRPR